MNTQPYRMTRMHLREALRGAIGMYLEYRNIHGRDEETAQIAGTDEILDGLDADRDLATEDPTERLRLQLPDTTADLLAACQATIYMFGRKQPPTADEILVVWKQNEAAIKKTRGEESPAAA